MHQYAPLVQKDFLASISTQSLMKICIVPATSTFWTYTPLPTTWSLALYVAHPGVLSPLPRMLIVLLLLCQHLLLCSLILPPMFAPHPRETRSNNTERTPWNKKDPVSSKLLSTLSIPHCLLPYQWDDSFSWGEPEQAENCQFNDKLLICHGTQQDVTVYCYMSVKINFWWCKVHVDKSSPEIAKYHICQPFLQPGQVMWLHMHVVSFYTKMMRKFLCWWVPFMHAPYLKWPQPLSVLNLYRLWVAWHWW